MNPKQPESTKKRPKSKDFVAQINTKVARKLQAKNDPSSAVWFGLGMMGLIGWSITVPTLLGAALGLWLDEQQKGQHSWTLALLMAGLCIGCFNAWHWIAKEDKAMHEKQHNQNDE
jgi:ATP synthase protein I